MYIHNALCTTYVLYTASYHHHKLYSYKKRNQHAMKTNMMLYLAFVLWVTLS